ncbi:hypothetical protein [Winogradskyella aurantia]|uniref:DUF4168 domain-containing protein n=1 Tax=Winogradskyella aurantia TaxID=1915063 RepID=A0A265UP57_9FLAO|nr:hypothetical protein [Winogradskyella aurantia]OZV67124.1 hypothetical protein CA834_12435 [Winogradskyella aurantia]
MKKLFLLMAIGLTFSLNAQDLKSLSKAKEGVTKSVDQSSFVEKFAGDQVKKLTEKFNLSEAQQTQVSDLVVSQLKTEKFQKLIGSFSPAQLMGSGAQDKISSNLMESDEFKAGMNKVLNEEQKKKN